MRGRKGDEGNRRRDEGTKGQRDEGTKRRRDKETIRRRDNKTERTRFTCKDEPDKGDLFVENRDNR